MFCFGTWLIKLGSSANDICKDSGTQGEKFFYNLNDQWGTNEVMWGSDEQRSEVRNAEKFIAGGLLYQGFACGQVDHFEFSRKKTSRVPL